MAGQFRPWERSLASKGAIGHFPWLDGPVAQRPSLPCCRLGAIARLKEHAIAHLTHVQCDCYDRHRYRIGLDMRRDRAQGQNIADQLARRLANVPCCLIGLGAKSGAQQPGSRTGRAPDPGAVRETVPEGLQE